LSCKPTLNKASCILFCLCHWWTSLASASVTVDAVSLLWLSMRIVIVNQSRRVCHFLMLWPQLLSRFGNRWRFALTVTRCPLHAQCRIFLYNMFSSQWQCNVVHAVDVPYDESWSSHFDSFLIGDMFRQIRCISPAIFETPLA